MIKTKKPTSQPVKSAQMCSVLKYFAFFDYAPSFDEIYAFLPIKTTKKELHVALEVLVKKKKVIKLILNTAPRYYSGSARYPIPASPATRVDVFAQRGELNTNLYALRGHSILFKKRTARAVETEKKINKVKLYLQIATQISPIKFIGLSGSVAMQNCKPGDDIDFCVIACPGRLWTARFILVLLAYLLRVKRARGVKQARDKICLNLFFDGDDLTITLDKRNLFTAHEVLQMVPIHMPGGAYEVSSISQILSKAEGQYLVASMKHPNNPVHSQFLKENDWVFDYFPNHQYRQNLALQTGKATIPTAYTSPLTSAGNLIEFILKKLQLFFINRHRTTEYITDTQLWFFPRDFKEKLRKNGLV